MTSNSQKYEERDDYFAPKPEKGGLQTWHVAVLIACLVAILLSIFILVPVVIVNRNKSSQLAQDGLSSDDFANWGTNEEQFVPVQTEKVTKPRNISVVLNFKEQLVLAIVKKMAACGRLEAVPVNNADESNSTVLTPIISTTPIICWRRVEMKPAGSAFVGELVEGLSVGRNISVRGRVKQNPTSFNIDLMGSNDDVPLRLNAEFQSGNIHKIVRKAYLSNFWGLEEHLLQTSSFQADGYLEIIIQCGAKAFSVVVNTIEIPSFNYRADITKITRVKVDGDFTLIDVRLM
ncbi:uncharacterized protein LOC144031534 [Festucalex cinctus]